MEKQEEEVQVALEKLNHKNEALKEKLLIHESVVKYLNSTIDHFKNNIHRRLHQIPKLDDIENTVYKALQAHFSHGTIYTKSLTLSATRGGMSGQAESSNTSAPKIAKSCIKKHSKSSALDRICKRTLFVKGVKDSKGRGIQSIIIRDRTCTAIPVDRVVIKPSHLEIICNIPDGASSFKRELQKNQVLNRDLVSSSKRSLHTCKSYLVYHPCSMPPTSSMIFNMALRPMMIK